MSRSMSADTAFVWALNEAVESALNSRLGWTHARLAEELGIQGGTFSKYLKGTITIPPHRLLRFCEWAGYSDDETRRLLALHPRGQMDPPVEGAFRLAAAVPLSRHRELTGLLDAVIGDVTSAVQYLSKARDRHFEREWDKTIALCEEADGVIEESYALLQAYRFDMLGTVHVHRNEVPDARRAYDQAAAFAERTGDHHIRGSTYMHQGDFSRHRGRWDDALDFYDLAHEEFTLAESQVNLARVQRKQAQVHLSRGEWPDARNLLHDAEKHLESEQSHHAEYERIKLHIALGWLYSLRGRQTEALTERSRAARQAQNYLTPQASPDPYLQAQAYTQAGYENLLAGQLQQAHYFLYDVFEKEQLPGTKEDALLWVGRARYWMTLYRTRQQNPAGDAASYLLFAEDCLDKAEEIGRVAQVPMHLATITRRRAELCMLRGEYAKADVNYRRALRGFRRLDAHYYVAATCLEVCQAIRARVNHSEAFYDNAQLRDMNRLMVEAEKEADDSEHPFADILARMYVLRADLALDLLIASELDDREARLSERVLKDYARAIRVAARYHERLLRQISREIGRGLTLAADVGLGLPEPSGFVQRYLEPELMGSAAETAEARLLLVRTLTPQEIKRLFQEEATRSAASDR
jgi:tetratricopeptide (TPR) repeat protein